MVMNSSSRNGVIPKWIVIHTAEGTRTVGDLYNFFNGGVAASSHAGADGYQLSGPWVDDTRAAWTLLNGNARSFNLEMCGFAAWSRATWLSTGWVWNPQHTAQCWNPRGIIWNAAKWVVQKRDAAKRIYGIDIPIGRKLSPSEVGNGAKGLFGHVDYTYGTGDGDHTDPGGNFPWDILIQDINAILGGGDDMPSPDDLWKHPITNPHDGYSAPARDWLIGNAAAIGKLQKQVDALPAELWDESLRGDDAVAEDGTRTPYSDKASQWLVDRARKDSEILEQLSELKDAVAALTALVTPIASANPVEVQE